MRKRDAESLCCQQTGMRKRILRAAFELIAEKGVDRVSVREIVAKAGATKPVLYYYFKDKEDLCEQLFADNAAEFENLVAGCVKKNLPLEKLLEGIFLSNITLHNERPKVSRMVLRTLSCSKDEPGTIALFDKMRRNNHATLMKAFRLAEARGEIPAGSSVDLLYLMDAAMASFLLKAAHFPPQKLSPRLPGRLAAMIVAGVRHGRSAKKAKC